MGKHVYGKKHPLYGGGKSMDSSGYVVLSSLEWGEHRGQREHRYVMEMHLGRKLERHEIVHHVDGNKANNAIENLEIKTRAEHNRTHGKGKEFTCAKCGKTRWYSESLAAELKTPYMCRKCYRQRVTTSNQKLSTEDARNILKLRLSGVKGKDLAQMYGVSAATICDIYKGRKHKW